MHGHECVCLRRSPSGQTQRPVETEKKTCSSFVSEWILIIRRGTDFD